MKHKHYDVIVAWAEGKKIQFKNKLGEWEDWEHRASPMFVNYADYRIKPEPKPDIKYLVRIDKSSKSEFSCPVVSFSMDTINTPNLRIVFDGETNKLKSAEVIK